MVVHALAMSVPQLMALVGSWTTTIYSADSSTTTTATEAMGRNDISPSSSLSPSAGRGISVHSSVIDNEVDDITRTTADPCQRCCDSQGSFVEEGRPLHSPSPPPSTPSCVCENTNVSSLFGWKSFWMNRVPATLVVSRGRVPARKSTETDDGTHKNHSLISPQSTSTNTLEDSPSLSLFELPKSIKLLIGTVGISVSFLYVGSLQEDVFVYVSDDDRMFDQAWFLQLMESVACLFMGFCGILFSGTRSSPSSPVVTGTSGSFLPSLHWLVWWSGAAQVAAKASANMALAAGLSYPTMVLAKSAKLAPVMLGTRLMGGASYTIRQYLQVLAIVIGTIMVSLSQQQQSHQLSPASSSSWGALWYIGLSLSFDGLVAGVQKRLQRDMAEVQVYPTPAEYLFWFSIPMAVLSACFVAGSNVSSTLNFVLANPALQTKLIRYATASAVGSSFVFYTLAHFNPVVVTTITTTRKLGSIGISLLFKQGHHSQQPPVASSLASLPYGGGAMDAYGWIGLSLAVGGILSQILAKQRERQPNGAKQLEGAGRPWYIGKPKQPPILQVQ